MAKKTYKITRFDLGRNSKYDARDLKDGELAEACNINITNPGYVAPSGNLKGYWNASNNNVQNHVVGTFESGSGTVDTNNTALTAFANDYKMGFVLAFNAGTNNAITTIGNTVYDNTSKASGTVVGSSTTGTWDGNASGTVYLINVTKSGNASAFGNGTQLKVGSTNVATTNGNTSVLATTTAPFLGLGDANTLDVYDDGTEVWLNNVLTLNNSITWNPDDPSTIGANASSVYQRYFYADGALRMGDANFANTNNYSKWLGHINRDYLQNILNDDGTAQTRDTVKMNSWWEDSMAPCPPQDNNPGTDEKALTVVDSYAATYPTNGEKVFLKFRESAASLFGITAIAVTDANTGLMTATLPVHGYGAGDEVVITGSAHGGTYVIEDVPSPTTFTFYSNYTAADSSIEGSDLIQNGALTSDATGWTVKDFDDNTGDGNGWTYGSAKFTFDNDENAYLINTLDSSATTSGGTTYHLKFTVGTATLNMSIEGGTADSDGNFQEYVSLTEYTHNGGAAGDGVYDVYFTPAGNSLNTDTKIRFKCLDDGSGAGTLDDISLKSTNVDVRKFTDAINHDLKEKWIFGMSFLYDGIAEQESPITVGWKDGSTQMDAGVSSSHVVDFRTYTNKPECYVSFVYDDTDESSRNWHPRKTGFKIYMKRVDTSATGEWLLFAHIDLVKGDYVINAGDGTVQPLYEGETNAAYEVNLKGENTLVPFNSVPLQSYFTETFGVPEHLTHFRASWKSQAICNRTNYIGNVLVDGEHYPDRLMKSPPLRYDIFPNDEAYFVDVMPSDGDEIVHLEAFGDRLLVFKKYTLIVLNTNGVAEVIEGKYTGMGVEGPRKICATDNGIAWINEQGLLYYDGESVKNLIEDKWDTVNLWSPLDASVGSNPISQLAYDAKAKQLILFGAKSNVGASITYIYDFYTKSFYYGFQLTPIASSGVNLFSNVVNIPHDNETVFAGKKESENIYFWKYQAASQDTPNDSGAGNAGFLLKTKDIDFGEPGVKKKIYKVYVTYKCSESSEDHTNLVCAYNVNGEDSGPLEVTGIKADGDYKHFKPVSNCQTFSGASSTNPCVLNNNKPDWTVAEMKPVPGEASKVNSIQLAFYNKITSVVDSTFKINDITIVYKMGKKK
tara:strand:+ start:349 stop:3726 length:3378 start_codon:yes stop_codon:yes gene_type:complete